MTIPFRRDHSDADRLNDLLDAMRSGTRAPDASADEANHLARTARQFRGLADRAASVDPAPATTFDAIWEDMMSAHTLAPPLPIDTGPATPITPETHRVPTVPGMPHQSRWQSLLSAAIVVVMLAGLVATAWNLRGTGDGGPTDPGENARLAATALQDGTPEASPESQPAWMDYTFQGAEHCAPIRTMQESDALINEDRDWPEREYLPFSDAPEGELDGIVQAARLSISCDNRTDRNYWEISSRFAPPYEEMADRQDAISEELSAAFPIQDPTAFVFMSHEEPEFGIGRSASPDFIMTPAYAPQHAMALADGRIAIPVSFVIWADDPNAPINPDGTVALNDFFRSGLLVLAQEDGEWRVDEQLKFCVGDCDTFWSANTRETLFLDPVPPPGQSTPSPATSIVMPDIEPETLTWISPEECVVEDDSSPQDMVEASSAMTDPTYTPLGRAQPDDATAAARAARLGDACFVANSGNTLDEYRFVASMEESFGDRASRQQEAGKAVSAEYPIDDTSQFFVFTDARPGASGNANLIFQPQHAVELDDGRILIPGTWLIWTGDPSFIQEAPEIFITQAVVMEELNGNWVLSENLPVCIGDCEGMWPEISPFVSEYSSIRAPAMQDGTPEVQDNEWLAYIQPEECPVEPLSDDAVATIAASPAAGEPRAYTPLTTPGPVMAEEAATVARAADACGLGTAGDPPVITSLWTDRFIAEQALSGPDNARETRARSVEIGKQISAAYPDGDPADLVYLSDVVPADTTIVDGQSTTISSGYLPSMAVQLPDGRIGFPGISILWTGNPNTPTQEQIDSLPWLISGFVILSDASGSWQIDELLPICFGECEEGWAEWSGEATPTPGPPTPEPTINSRVIPLPGTPIASPATTPAMPAATLGNRARPRHRCPDATR